MEKRPTNGADLPGDVLRLVFRLAGCGDVYADDGLDGAPVPGPADGAAAGSGGAGGAEGAKKKEGGGRGLYFGAVCRAWRAAAASPALMRWLCTQPMREVSTRSCCGSSTQRVVTNETPGAWPWQKVVRSDIPCTPSCTGMPDVPMPPGSCRGIQLPYVTITKRGGGPVVAARHAAAAVAAAVPLATFEAAHRLVHAVVFLLGRRGGGMPRALIVRSLALFHTWMPQQLRSLGGPGKRGRARLKKLLLDGGALTAAIDCIIERLCVRAQPRDGVSGTMPTQTPPLHCCVEHTEDHPGLVALRGSLLGRLCFPLATMTPVMLCCWSQWLCNMATGDTVPPAETMPVAERRALPSAYAHHALTAAWEALDHCREHPTGTPPIAGKSMRACLDLVSGALKVPQVLRHWCSGQCLAHLEFHDAVAQIMGPRTVVSAPLEDALSRGLELMSTMPPEEVPASAFPPEVREHQHVTGWRGLRTYYSYVQSRLATEAGVGYIHGIARTVPEMDLSNLVIVADCWLVSLDTFTKRFCPGVRELGRSLPEDYWVSHGERPNFHDVPRDAHGFLCVRWLGEAQVAYVMWAGAEHSDAQRRLNDTAEDFGGLQLHERVARLLGPGHPDRLDSMAKTALCIHDERRCSDAGKRRAFELLEEATRRTEAIVDCCREAWRAVRSGGGDGGGDGDGDRDGVDAEADTRALVNAATTALHGLGMSKEEARRFASDPYATCDVARTPICLLLPRMHNDLGRLLADDEWDGHDAAASSLLFRRCLVERQQWVDEDHICLAQAYLNLLPTGAAEGLSEAAMLNMTAMADNALRIRRRHLSSENPFLQNMLINVGDMGSHSTLRLMRFVSVAAVLRELSDTESLLIPLRFEPPDMEPVLVPEMQRRFADVLASLEGERSGEGDLDAIIAHIRLTSPLEE